MRIIRPVLTMALYAAAFGPAGWAQSQQGQSDSSAQQSANAKQPTPAKPKAESKPPILLTDENLDQALGKNGTQASAPLNAQADPKTGEKQSGGTPGQKPNQQAASAAAAAKPKLQLDSHKVLTNDDLSNFIGAKGVNVVGMGVDLNGIYDCDTNCYNQVREAAKVYPGRDLAWMRELHSGIEKLESDENWRAFLVNLADIRSRYCKLAAEQSSALARVDNENNVTNEQISIREDYNRKLDALSQETSAAYNSIGAVQGKYSTLVRYFMQVQETRIAQSSCANPQRNNDDPEQDDPNEK